MRAAVAGARRPRFRKGGVRKSRERAAKLVGGYSEYAMYELSVQRQFRATHAITMAGVREPVHEHDWLVTVVVAGEKLDQDGLLCDFLVIQRELDRIIGDLNERDLNATPPFDRVNPTAEHVARHIAEQAAEAMKSHATVSRVTVTEEPGCAATYRMS